MASRPWGSVLVVLVALVGVGVGCGGGETGGKWGEAEWIWARTESDRVAPLAFYAVKDFSVEKLPEEARLAVVGDEEYTLWVNGRRVGSNRHHDGDAPDSYDVTPYLLPGPNRLTAELRSSRGPGGFLAALSFAAGAPHVVSDRSWRIARRQRPGLVEGWAPVPEDETAFSWGRPPVGRWDHPGEPIPRPLPGECGDPCNPVPAEHSEGEAPFRVAFDWGREVTGYLAITRPAPEASALTPEVALASVGAEPPTPLSHPDRAVALVTLPGDPTWVDTVPRTFRHAAVVGLAGDLTATVLPVDPAALDLLPRPDTPPPRGVLGLTPPPQPTPAENEVRRKLLKARQADGAEG